MTDALMSVVRISREPTIEIAHEVRQVGFGRLDDEMVVITQSGFDECTNTVILQRVNQNVDESRSIIVIFENDRLTVPTSHHVINPVRNVQSWWSWHLPLCKQHRCRR